jgi:hypothetical protein
MSISSSTHLRTVHPNNRIDAQSLPEDVQQRVCDVISVRERPATQALACVNNLFKRNMEEKRQLLLIADDIKNPVRSNTAWKETAFEKHLGTLAESSPAARTKVFLLLTKLTTFPHPVFIARHCRLLWEHLHLLPLSERSQAILALGKIRAHIPYGLVGKLIDEAPHPDQAGLLGVLSYRLKSCSDAKFPDLLQALFVKVSHLSDKDQAEALVQIYQFTGSFLDQAGSRYRQLYVASQHVLLTLPVHLQVLPAGVWTVPTQTA